MRLPLLRPLRYRDFAFVQGVQRGDWPVQPGRASLIDDLDSLRSATFDPARVHPTIRRFYEGSTGCRMSALWLRWETWALPLAYAYVPIARRLGNLCVPDVIDDGARMSSTVHRFSPSDGNESRRWTRAFSGANTQFYTAAFRPWVDREAGATYLSMAFPFPGAHVMVLLRMRNDGDGMVCSTRYDDLAGTYLVMAGRTRFVALPGPPTDEVLTFRAQTDDITALHEDFMYDRRTFALEYRIAHHPRSAQALPHHRAQSTSP
jgi:hypothetical protein